MTKVHRVAFAGASGTGKSTLSRWMETTFSLPMNPIGSRSIARDMDLASAHESVAVGRRVEFQTRLMESKAAWEEAHPEFVTDRTTLDNLAYSVMYNAADITDQYLDLVCKALQRYEYIIYCPVAVFCNVEADPARVKSLSYHMLYDAALWGLLHKFRPPEVRLITLPFANLEHRKGFIRALMKPT